MPALSPGVNLFKTPGTYGYTAPYDGYIDAEGWSSGSSGLCSSSTGWTGGGAGGWVQSDRLYVRAGQTIWFRVPPGGAGSSVENGSNAGSPAWLNVLENAVPTSQSQGFMVTGAARPDRAYIGTTGGISPAQQIGVRTFNGGNAIRTTTDAAVGGSGAATNATYGSGARSTSQGALASPNTSGNGGPDGGAGGAGAPDLNSPGSPGQWPGGGGGNSRAVGQLSGAGGDGAVLILFTAAYATTRRWVPSDVKGLQPSSAPTVQAWYALRDVTGVRAEGADLTRDTTNPAIVTGWRDRSGQGHDLVPYLTARTDLLPVFDANGLKAGVAALTGNGSQWLESATVANGGKAFTPTGQPLNVFVAGLQATPTSSNRSRLVSLTKSGAQDSQSGSSIPMLQATASGLGLCAYNAGTSSATLALNAGEAGVFGTVAPNATQTQMMLNGGASVTSLASAVASNYAFERIGVGGSPGSAASAWQGAWAETLVIFGVLPTYERECAEAYVAWNNGLQDKLPASHRFKSTPPFISVASTGDPGGPNSRLWNPTDFGSDLVAWWDASDLILGTGATVTSWKAKGALGLVATAAGLNAITFDSAARNGKPGIVFDGTSTWLTWNGAVMDGLSDATAAASAWMNTGASNGSYRPLLSFGSATGTIANNMSMEPAKLTTGYAGSQMTGSTVSLWKGLDHFVTETKTGPQGTFVVDGGADSVSNASAFGDNIAANEGNIGRNLVTRSWSNWWGIIQQIVILKRALSTGDRQILEGWESWYNGKGGTNLPYDHPYRNVAPTVSARGIILPRRRRLILLAQ